MRGALAVPGLVMAGPAPGAFGTRSGCGAGLRQWPLECVCQKLLSKDRGKLAAQAQSPREGRADEQTSGYTFEGQDL